MLNVRRPSDLSVETQDVSGDGNCFWWCLQALTKQPARAIKLAAFRALPQLRPVWLQRHEYCTSELWEQYVRHQDRWGRDANEIMACSASIVLDRAICIVSDGYVSLFSPSKPSSASIAGALGVVLHKGHYQYMTQRIPESVVQLLLASVAEGTSSSEPFPDLSGGGRVLLSWNIGSMMLRWQELLSLAPWDLVCLQETGVTARNQRFLENELAKSNLSVVWGQPTPTGWNRNSRLRSLTGSVPGVAIVSAQSLALRYRKPQTAAGLHLEKRGRMVLASYPTPVSQVLIACVYLPSGGSSETVKDRSGCLDDVMEELVSYGSIPALVIGDWNLEPSDNPIVPVLSARHWLFPLANGDDPFEAPYSYTSPSGRSYLDYAMVSEHLPVYHQSLKNVGSQHLLVEMSLPDRRPDYTPLEVPQGVSYGTFKHREDMLHFSTFRTQALTPNQVWEDFQDRFHMFLCSRSSNPPKKRPGQPVFRVGKASSRLTNEGGETKLAKQASALLDVRSSMPSIPLLSSIARWRRSKLVATCCTISHLVQTMMIILRWQVKSGRRCARTCKHSQRSVLRSGEALLLTTCRIQHLSCSVGLNRKDQQGR